MALIDSFDGAATNGLDTADTGQNWVLLAGPASNWSESGGAGIVTPSSAGGTVRTQLLPCTNNNGDIYLDFDWASDPVGASQLIRLYFRVQSTSSVSDGYRLTISKSPGSGATAVLARLVATIPTTLANVTIPGDIVAGTTYRIHVALSGTSKIITVWNPLLAEPAALISDNDATWQNGVALALAHQATSGNTNLARIHFWDLFGSVEGAVASRAVTPTWNTRFAGSFAGGYCQTVALDPRVAGGMTIGGDVYGLHHSDNYGSFFTPRAKGFSIANGVVNGNCTIRSVVAGSQKYPGRWYYGAGTAKGGIGNGHFGYFSTLDQDVVKANTTYGLGANLPAGAQNFRPRGTGQLIVVDYDPGTGTEYIYMAGGNNSNHTNVIARSTDGGVTWTELWSGVNTGGAWSALEVFDSDGDGIKDALIFSSYRDTTLDFTTPGGCIIQMLTAGSASIRTATGNAQLTTTPVGALPSVVEDIRLCHNGIDLIAACGPFGVYTASDRTGLHWSRQDGGFFTQWVSALDGDSNTHMVAALSGAGNYGDPAAQIVALYKSGTWSWISPSTVTHSNVGTGFLTYPWGVSTGGWWLMESSFRYSNYLGGVPMDVQQIQMDRFDTRIIACCGSGGSFLTKDEGVSWRPAVNGYCGGESGGVKAFPNGVVYYDDVDYGDPASGGALVVKSSNGAITSRRSGETPPTFVVGVRTLTDAAGNTYDISTTTGNPQILRNGVDITDQLFKQALMSFKAWDIAPDAQRIYISQYGGGLLVVEAPSFRVVKSPAPANAVRVLFQGSS